jgi:hypothetical protein
LEEKLNNMRRPDIIYAILEKKRAAYGEFLSATLLLKKALEMEETLAVNGLIERRAELTRMVDELDQEIIRCQKTGVEREIVTRTAAISADLTEKLRQIISANRDCDAAASGRLSVLRKELMIIHEQEKGLRGYTGRGQQVPRFLNVST